MVVQYLKKGNRNQVFLSKERLKKTIMQHIVASLIIFPQMYRYINIIYLIFAIDV